MLQYPQGFVADTTFEGARLELSDFTEDGRAKLLRCWAPANAGECTFEVRLERRAALGGSGSPKRGGGGGCAQS